MLFAKQRVMKRGPQMNPRGLASLSADLKISAETLSKALSPSDALTVEPRPTVPKWKLFVMILIAKDADAEKKGILRRALYATRLDIMDFIEVYAELVSDKGMEYERREGDRSAIEGRKDIFSSLFSLSVRLFIYFAHTVVLGQSPP